MPQPQSPAGGTCSARLRRGKESARERPRQLGDELVAREPERVVDDASKPKALVLACDEPGPPADDRLDVIGRRAHGARTRSGSIGCSGEGSTGDSAGSVGSSRGTGSSSGSTV